MLQVTGLISGIDVDSIIEEVIKAESVPKTRLEERITVEEAKKSTLRDINSNLMILQSRAATLSDSDTLLAKIVSSSDESILTATATKEAALGSYEIEVTQLATASEIESTRSISESIDPTRRIVRVDPGTFTIDGLDTDITVGSKYYDANVSGTTISDISTTLDSQIETSDKVRVAMSEPLELTVTGVAGNQITLNGDVDNYTTIFKIEPSQVNIDITGNITDSGVTATITGITDADDRFSVGDYVRITKALSTDINVAGNIEAVGVTYSRAKITLDAEDFSKFNVGDKIQITDGSETQIVTVLNTDDSDNSIIVDTGTIDGYLENYTTITAINPSDGIPVTRSFQVTNVYDDAIEVDTDGLDLTNYRAITQINPKYTDIDITGQTGSTINVPDGTEFNEGDKIFIGAELILTAGDNSNKSNGQITVTGTGGVASINDYDKVQLLTSLNDIAADITNLSAEYVANYDGTKLTITKTSSRDNADSFSGSPIRFSQEDTNFIDVTRLSEADQTVYSISTVDGLDETDTLQDLGISAGTFTVNYFEYEVDDPANHTLGDVIDAINDSSAGVTAEIVGGQLKFSIENGTLRIGSDSDDTDFLTELGFDDIVTTVSSYDLNLDGNSYELVTSKASVRNYAGFKTNPTLGTASLNNHELSIDLTTTLDEITTAITSSDFPKLEAFYDIVEDKITMTNDETRIGFGSDSDTSNLIDALVISPNAQSIDSETGMTTVISSSRIGAINPNTKLSELSLANGIVDEEGTFKINSIEIAYDPDDTLQDVIDRINSSDANVNASYNSVTDKIEMESTITGNPKIKIESVTATTITLDDIDIDEAGTNLDQVIADKLNGRAYILDGSDFGIYDLTDPEAEVYNELDLRQIVHDPNSDSITGNITDVVTRAKANQVTIQDTGTPGSESFSDVSFGEADDWDKVVVKRDPATGEQTDHVYMSDGDTLWHYDLSQGENGKLTQVTDEIPTGYSKRISNFTIAGDYAYVLVEDKVLDSRLTGSSDTTPRTPDSGNIYQVDLATGAITDPGIDDVILGKPTSITAASTAETIIKVAGGDDGYVVNDYVTIHNTRNDKQVVARITDINRGTDEITINAYLDKNDFTDDDFNTGKVRITSTDIPSSIDIDGQVYQRSTYTFITTEANDVMNVESSQIAPVGEPGGVELTITSRIGDTANDDTIIVKSRAANQLVISGFFRPVDFTDYTNITAPGVGRENSDARITKIGTNDPWISAKSNRLGTQHNESTITIQPADDRANFTDGNTVVTFSGHATKADVTETIDDDPGSTVYINSANNDLSGYTEITQADISGDNITADVMQEARFSLKTVADANRFKDGDTVKLDAGSEIIIDVDGTDLVHGRGTDVSAFGGGVPAPDWGVVRSNTFRNSVNNDIQYKIQVTFTDGVTNVDNLDIGKYLRIDGVDYQIEEKSEGGINGTVIARAHGATNYNNIDGNDYNNANDGVIEADDIVYDPGGADEDDVGGHIDSQITRLRIPDTDQDLFKDGDTVRLEVSGQEFTITGVPYVDPLNAGFYLMDGDRLEQVNDNYKIDKVTYNTGANLITIDDVSHETRIFLPNATTADRFKANNDVVTVNGVRVYVDAIENTTELVYQTTDGSSPGVIDNNHNTEQEHTGGAGRTVTNRPVTLIEYENNYDPGSGRTGNAIGIQQVEQYSTITLPNELADQFGSDGNTGQLTLEDTGYSARTFDYTVDYDAIDDDTKIKLDTSGFVIGNDNTKITQVNNGVDGFIPTYFPIAQITAQNDTTIENLTADEHYQFRNNDQIQIDDGANNERIYEIDSGTATGQTNPVKLVDPGTGNNPTEKLTHFQLIEELEQRDPVTIQTREQVEGQYELTLRDNDFGLDDTAKFYDGDTLYYRYDGQDHELTVTNGGVNPARVVIGITDAETQFTEGQTGIKLTGLPAPYDDYIFKVTDVDATNDTITVSLDPDWADYGWWKTSWMDNVDDNPAGGYTTQVDDGVHPLYTPNSVDKRATTYTVEGIIPTLAGPYGRIVTETDPSDGRQLKGMFVAANDRLYVTDSSRSLRSIDLNNLTSENNMEDYKLNTLVGQITNLLYVDDAGNYAYVVGSNTNNDIWVIDISDPEDPQDTGERITLNGDVTDTLIREEDEVTYLYVVDGSNTIKKIDVSTDSSAPESVDINLGVANIADFTIVELDKNPELVAPNNNPLNISETLIYVRENDNDVHIFNLPSRTDLTLSSTAGLSVGDVITIQDAGTDVGKFKIDAINGDVVTIASKQWSSLISTGNNIVDNGATINEKTDDETVYDITPTATPNGYDVFAKDNKAYIVKRNTGNNESSLERFLGATYREVAYIADGTTDVMLADITNTSSMKQHNDLVFANNVSDIATYGDNLYAVEGNTLRVLNISDPFGSTANKNATTTGINNAVNVFVYQNNSDSEVYAYVVDTANGLTAYQAGNDGNDDGVPDSYTQTGDTHNLSAALVDSDVYYDGNDKPKYLYITDGTSTITRVDLQFINSANMITTLNLPVTNNIKDVAISTGEDIIYVTDSTDKVYAFDISGATPRDITPATAPVENREVFTYDEQVFMVSPNTSVMGNPGNVIKKYDDGAFPNEFMGLLDLNEESGVAGDNAMLKVNGDEYERNLNSIDDVVPNVTLELKDTGSSTVTIESDVDSAVESVNKFVEQYNTVQSLLRDTITEKRVFRPEDEEELVKGALANDTTLRSLYQRLQLITTGSIAGASSEVKTLGDIGLSRGAAGTVTITQIKSGLDLKVDETTLRDALRTNPTDVANVFGSVAVVDIPSSNMFSYGSTLSEISDTGYVGVSFVSSDPITKTTVLNVGAGNIGKFAVNDVVRVKGTADGSFLTPYNLRVTQVSSPNITVYTGSLDISNYDIIDRIIESTPENSHLAKMTLSVPSGKVSDFLKEQVRVKLKESDTNEDTVELNLVGINPNRSTITLEPENGSALPDTATALSGVALTGEREVTVLDILDDDTGDRSAEADWANIEVSSLRKVGDQIVLTVPSTVLHKFMEDLITVTEYEDEDLTTIDQDEAGNNIVAEDLEIASVDTHNNLVEVYVPHDKFLDSSKYKTTSISTTPSETRTRITKISGTAGDVDLTGSVSVNEIMPATTNVTEVSNLSVVDLRKYERNDLFTLRQNGTETDLTIINTPVDTVDIDASIVSIGDRTVIEVDASDIDKFLGKDKITVKGSGFVNTVRILSVDITNNEITVSTPGGSPEDISTANKITEIADTLRVRGQLGSIALDSEIMVEGVGERIEELLSSYTKILTGLIDTRISSIDSNIEDLNEDIEEIEQRLDEKEDELIREFAQLETALGRIQIQSQFLTQQIMFLQNSALFSFGGRRRRGGIFG